MENSFARNWENEYNKYNRHAKFIQTMIENKSKNIDWDCFWSWYYHSNCSSKEALKNAKNP